MMLKRKNKYFEKKKNFVNLQFPFFFVLFFNLRP